MRGFFSRARAALPFQPAPEREVEDELAFHLEQRIRDYVARGMDPATARNAALERFGDLQGVRRECTHLLEEDRLATARRDWLDDLRQDLRFGARSALRAPTFSLLAIATLALGIGANAAVFGVVKSVLLDALPYDNADRLVRVYGHLQTGSLERSAISAGAAVDIATRARSFDRTTTFLHSTWDLTYAAESGPRVITSALISPGFFQTLGVRPLIGRALADADTVAGAPDVTILSYATWQRYFSGDPRVLGKSARIDGDPHEIIGVLPRGFVGPMGDAEFWFPIKLSATLRDPVSSRKSHWLGVVARLRPGITPEVAQQELTAIATDLAREYPESDGGHGFTSLPIRHAMVGETRTPLLVLMASAGLVLLITCANLAGALLSRTLSRRKEFAVRVAVGAGRGRLVRQLLTESSLLAIVGGAFGLGLAMLGLAALRKLALTALPPYAELSLDLGAILATSIVALVTGLAFGVAPALSIRRADPQGTLRDETRGTSESRRSRRLRGALVAGQIALSVSLLAGAGLLARSLWAMTAAPLGFNPEGVFTAGVKLPYRAYQEPETRRRFFAQLETRLRAVPGVRGAAMVSELPSPRMNRNGLAIEGVSWPAGAGQPFVAYASVSDDYFRTMGIPLLHGRTFGPSDRADGQRVVLISEGMARRYWPRGNAVGARIRLGPRTTGPWTEVVGIVGNVRNDPTVPDPEPMAYASNRQDTWGNSAIVVRAQRDPLALARPVQRELSAIDRSLPLYDPTTLEARLADELAARRLPVVLMTAFGALALLLASVGVYAMFASMAAAREREFGVRVALGSSRRAIAGLVLRQGGLWMAVGLAGGAIGVVVVVRLVRDLLYGVAPFDPVALGVAVVTLLACGTVALLVPVRRATRADPVAVLR
jgi:predicted permease